MEQLSRPFRAELDKIPYRDRAYLHIQMDVIDLLAAGAAVFSDSQHLLDMAADGKLVYEEYVRQLAATYATFEKDRTRADGRQWIASAVPGAHWQGWASADIGGEDAKGTFDVPPVVRIEFVDGAPHDLPALSFVFDVTTGCYPTKLRVVATRANGMVLYDSLVYPDRVDYVFLQPFRGVTHLELHFLEAGRPYTRARLQNVTFGARMRFDNDRIRTATKVQEIDPAMRRVEESTLDFGVINVDGDVGDNGLYDPDNPDGLWQWMEAQHPLDVKYGQRSRSGMTWADVYAPDPVTGHDWQSMLTYNWEQLYSGGFIEWVRGGHYVLAGQPAATGITADFKAQSQLSVLNTVYTKGLYRPAGISLYDLAKEILEDAALPVLVPGELPYYLDGGLRSKYTVAPMPKLKIVECLQLIAHAAGMVAYTDRKGVIRIELAKQVADDYRMDFNTVIGWGSISTTKTPPLRQVDVNVYGYTPAPEEKELHKADYEPGSYEAEFDWADHVRIVNEGRIKVRAFNSLLGHDRSVELGLYDDAEIYVGVAAFEPARILSEADDLPEWEAYIKNSYQIDYTGSEPVTFSRPRGRIPGPIKMAPNARTGFGARIAGKRAKPALQYFTVRAENTDPATGEKFHDEKEFKIVVNPPLPPTINTDNLINARAGTAYKQQVTAGGTNTTGNRITFTRKAKDAEHQVPTALKIDKNTGVLTWDPVPAYNATDTSKNKYDFLIRAKNAQGFDEKSATIEVVNTAVKPQIFTDSLPDGAQYEPYGDEIPAPSGTGLIRGVQIEAAGTGKLTYTMSPAALNGGITLNPSTGVLSGTPTITGINEVTITVTDANGASNAARLKLDDFTVDGPQQPKITTKSLPNAILGKVYNRVIKASGGENIGFKALEQHLPPNMGFDEGRGAVVGTPGDLGVAITYLRSGVVRFDVTWAGRVTITGAPLEESSFVETTPVADAGEAEVLDNKLVTDVNVARAMAAYQAGFLADRAVHEFDYRGDPSIDAADIVDMQSRFTQSSLARVVRHELGFDGALHGKVIVKRREG